MVNVIALLKCRVLCYSTQVCHCQVCHFHVSIPSRFLGLPFSRLPFSTLCSFPVCQIQVCHFQSPRRVIWPIRMLKCCFLWCTKYGNYRSRPTARVQAQTTSEKNVLVTRYRTHQKLFRYNFSKGPTTNIETTIITIILSVFLLLSLSFSSLLSSPFDVTRHRSLRVL